MISKRILTGMFTVVVLLCAGMQAGAQTIALKPLPGAISPEQIKDPALAQVDLSLIQLQQEFEVVQRQPTFKEFKPSNPQLPVIATRVAIDATASADARSLLAQLETLGLRNGTIFGRMVSGQLPIEAIDSLAGLKGLKFVRPAFAITRTGSVDSQGDTAMLSDVARVAFDVDGTGTAVGTLSDSFDCKGTQQAVDVASGDLPAGILVLDDTGCLVSSSDEGRAMMQLIHDVAPGAAQSFHTAFNGQAEFAEGILRLATEAGARVIVDDVIYPAEPMFQDGIIAQAVDQVKNMGAAYFSAAGNEGRDGYESAYRDSGVLGQTGIRHDFDPGPGVDDLQTISMVPGIYTFSLQWSEPYFSVSGGPGSASDLDIALYLSDGTFIGVGGFSQNVGGDPIEVFSFRVAQPTQLQISIELVSGPPPETMKYVFFGPVGTSIEDFATHSATIYGHANAAGAEAVGAAFYADTPAFGVDPAILEPYSSAGPTAILFDPAGNRLAKAVIRKKPELVGPDGTNTTFFVSGVDLEPDGLPNFRGTSAAAPHAAAVAALMLEADSNLSPDDLYAALEKTAADMEDSGFDYDSGFGLVQADAAVEAVKPPDEDPDLTGEWLLIKSRKLLGLTLTTGRLQVSNIGTRDADRFRVAFYLSDDGVTPGQLLRRKWFLQGLTAGASRIVSFRYLSVKPFSGRYIIALIDDKNQVAETDETNNAIAVWVP